MLDNLVNKYNDDNIIKKVYPYYFSDHYDNCIRSTLIFNKHNKFRLSLWKRDYGELEFALKVITFAKYACLDNNVYCVGINIFLINSPWLDEHFKINFIATDIERTVDNIIMRSLGDNLGAKYRLK